MTDAVVLPGAMFGSGAPLPMFASDVAERRGATIHRHAWVGQRPDPPDPALRDWVVKQVEPLLDTVGGQPLVIAKSLGTVAAGLAAERSLPAVWLTPLLHVDWVVADLERATAPFLLVGGTGDLAWDAATARRLTPHVFEVDGADHGLYVPGPLTASVEVLGRMVVAVEEFFDAIGWPG
jgi:hypothetical protein